MEKINKFEQSILNLPQEKQQEYKNLINELSVYVFNKLKEHDFCPSFICLGSETFGYMSLLSELNKKYQVESL